MTKSSFLLLMSVSILMAPFKIILGSAFAADFCVELTATEFNHQAERRGDYNACARGQRSSIEALARQRARSNASNAIASHCLKNVTPSIQQRACSRVQFSSQHFGQRILGCRASYPEARNPKSPIYRTRRTSRPLRPDARSAHQNTQFC